MRSGCMALVLMACGGGAAAPTISHTAPVPAGDLRSELSRELGPSAYLTAGDGGLLAHGGGKRRVLVADPINAAAYDASLELVVFTMAGEAGVWSIDLRARAAEPKVVVDGTGNGDFAIGWFDDRQLTSNTAAVNISIDLQTGQVSSTRSANEGPVDPTWQATMRNRKRRALPAPVALVDGTVTPFGKTGLAIVASDAGLLLRRGDRAATLEEPAKWLAVDSDELVPSCAVIEVDGSEQRWFAAGAICSANGCDRADDADRPIGWLDPGPVVRPACAGTDEPSP